jgi:hypothetical protein
MKTTTVCIFLAAITVAFVAGFIIGEESGTRKFVRSLYDAVDEGDIKVLATKDFHVD